MARTSTEPSRRDRFLHLWAGPNLPALVITIIIAIMGSLFVLAANTLLRPIVDKINRQPLDVTSAEVTTTVRFGLPVRHVLLDNGQLGKITKEQYAASYPAWKTGLTNPDFAEYARLCGATGLAVRTRAELEEAMATAMGPIDGPVMVHIHTDPELV